MDLKTSVQLRLRLVRKTAYRFWRLLFISRAKHLINNISYADNRNSSSYSPCIILSSFIGVRDILVLSYLLRDQEVAFIAAENLPNNSLLNTLRIINQVLIYRKRNKMMGFFKEVLTSLTKYNRSVVICPDAIKMIAPDAILDPKILIRMAMKSSVPIVTVSIEWKNGCKGGSPDVCNVFIGKRVFVSPRTEEFRDIFFNRRGARKFEKLTDDELMMISARIFQKLNLRNAYYGPNVPKKVDA